MKTPKDEQYIVIMAYKVTIFDFEIFLVLSYIACLCYPYI